MENKIEHHQAIADFSEFLTHLSILYIKNQILP